MIWRVILTKHAYWLWELALLHCREHAWPSVSGQRLPSDSFLYLLPGMSSRLRTKIRGIPSQGCWGNFSKNVMDRCWTNSGIWVLLVVSIFYHTEKLCLEACNILWSRFCMWFLVKAGARLSPIGSIILLAWYCCPISEVDVPMIWFLFKDSIIDGRSVLPHWYHFGLFFGCKLLQRLDLWEGKMVWIMQTK